MNTINNQFGGKKLVIIGAGDLAREIHAWFPEVPLKGFLGLPSLTEGDKTAGPLLGDPDVYVPEPDEVFLCAISSNAIRLKICERFSALQAEFVTLVHPTALIGPQVSIGHGCVVFPGAILDVNSRVGNHVMLYFRSGVGHDSVVGDGCNVLTNGVVGAHCVVEKGCTISTLAFCNSGASMGAFSLIAANSFAARDVPPGATAIGVPARNVLGGQRLPSKASTPDATIISGYSGVSNGI